MGEADKEPPPSHPSNGRGKSFKAPQSATEAVRHAAAVVERAAAPPAPRHEPDSGSSVRGLQQRGRLLPLQLPRAVGGQHGARGRLRGVQHHAHPRSAAGEPLPVHVEHKHQRHADGLRDLLPVPVRCAHGLSLQKRRVLHHPLPAGGQHHDVSVRAVRPLLRGVPPVLLLPLHQHQGGGVRQRVLLAARVRPAAGAEHGAGAQSRGHRRLRAHQLAADHLHEDLHDRQAAAGGPVPGDAGAAGRGPGQQEGVAADHGAGGDPVPAALESVHALHHPVVADRETRLHEERRRQPVQDAGAGERSVHAEPVPVGQPVPARGRARHVEQSLLLLLQEVVQGSTEAKNPFLLGSYSTENVRKTLKNVSSF